MPESASRPDPARPLSPEGAFPRAAHRWRSLWSAPSGNARFLILSGGMWTFLQAATEPYKALFYNRIGLGAGAIGLLVAADLVVRSAGLALSGWAQRRFGAKRMLVLADSVSWVLPYLVLSLASRPWHVVAAVLLTSLNAFASTPYNCLMAHGMPAGKRTRAYAFLHLWNIVPSLFVPWLAGLLVARNPFLPLLRSLFLTQALCMAAGIAWRAQRLEDLPGRPMPEGGGVASELRRILSNPAFLPAWGALVFQGIFSQVWGNFAAIFLVRHLGASDQVPAWMAEAGALGFASGSILLQSRLREGSALRAAPWGLALHACVILAMLLRPGAGFLAALAFAGGLGSSLYTAATSSVVTSALPENLRDHGFAISSMGVQLVGAATMPLVGATLQWNLGTFPWIAGGALSLWALGIAAAHPRLGGT